MLKHFIKKKLIISILAIILVAVLWLTKILPSGLCILTATIYVNSNHSDRNFKYSFIEYSTAHGEYFVHFVDKDGKKIAIMTTPLFVKYDPLNPPG